MGQGKSNIGPLALAVIITAIVVGGGVYLWQKNQMIQPKQETPEQATAPSPSKISKLDFLFFDREENSTTQGI